MNAIEQVQMAIDGGINDVFDRNEHHEARAAIKELIDMEWNSSESQMVSAVIKEVGCAASSAVIERGAKAMLQRMLEGD